MKKLLFLFAASLFCSSAIAEDEIIFAPAVTDITTKPGATFELPFNLTNTVQCISFQWRILKSDEFSVVYDATEEEYAVDFGDRLTNKYTIGAKYTPGEDFQIQVTNMQLSKLMPTGSGLFCTMTYKVGADVDPGTYQLEMVNPVFAWGNGSSFYPDGAIITVKVGTAGIDGIAADLEEEDGTLYDLLGRPVTNPSPGIYLQKGRKVIVK